MKKKRILLKATFEDSLSISIHRTNVVFHPLIDGAGNVFKINKKELLDLLLGIK